MTGNQRDPRFAGFFPREDDIPVPHRLGVPLVQRDYLCDGRLVAWPGPLQDVHSPVCIEAGVGPEPCLVGSYPLLTETEALEVLNAACRAYDNGRGLWPTLPIEERIRHVEHFALRMGEVRTEVVRLLMWEIGKTLPDAEKEFDRTVDYIRDTIDALKELDRVSSRFVIEMGVIAQVRRAPLGVALCMGPYNYPLNETFTTLIPALIMGNTVIFKPPKLGVLLHRPLLEAFRDAFPPGVVNTVYGEGQRVIAPLLASGRINVLAFIGSSRVADLLKHQHPKPHRLRSILGLEAKNAGIILPDADIKLAVRECVLGSLSYNGQRCTALKILFVHASIIEDFLDQFCAAVDTLPAGMPWEPGVQLTPLPESGKIDYLRGLVEDALSHGAHIVNGGGQSHASFMRPAVVHPVTPAMRLYRDEQFGPVVPVCPFDDIGEPMRYIAESEYGQQVSIFGTDPAALADLIDPLVNQVCRVNLNSQCQRGPDSLPFTGRKDSAEGTLSVSDALRAFSIRTLVAAKQNELNKGIIRAIVTERASAFLSTDFIL
ncbi:NADP-dependent glyceraldehyde-3-phosphate dehydrogenase [Methylolobus aquaticus]|nr:NADP-dependent glyceraldehyde-3-phosphate dehydrogenase [Methylolobus aquaticus]